jgi:tetratricopeptide (TPR) repeat protein
VIIPAYKQAEYLGAAIESVLRQSYQNFEVIVVNDASPDHTEEVVQQYHDPRLKYLEHERNQGLPATRNTGINASDGEIVALLDSDDLFHPEKLRMHVEFLTAHPEAGVTYNPRFELCYGGDAINGLVRPPASLGLADLALGFPFTPSDMVLRRQWLERVDGFDGSLRNYSEDLDINCRLALAGCTFARVDRALNYRRFHSARPLNIAPRLQAALQVLESIFAHPHCPAEVQRLRALAYRINYLVWGDVALAQGETALAQNYLRNAVLLQPAIINGFPCEIIRFFTWSVSCDDNVDHAALLERYMQQLPPEFFALREQYVWAVGQGHLIKGARAALWDRPEDSRSHFEQAQRLNAQVDEGFVRKVADDLINYDVEFQAEATQQALARLQSRFHQIDQAAAARHLESLYAVNRAFRHFHCGQVEQARKFVFSAIANDPKHLTNRGVISILLRSLPGVVWRSHHFAIAESLL